MRDFKMGLFRQSAVALFDSNGRFKPDNITKPVSNLGLDYSGSKLWFGHNDYRIAYCMLTRCLQPEIFVSINEFNLRIKRLLKRIKRSPQLSNVLRGAWYPIMLPQIEVNDVGEAIDNIFSPAVARACYQTLPQKKFVSWHSIHYDAGLAGKVIVHRERQKKLIKRIRTESLVGIICFPFKGFCRLATWEAENMLPDWCCLAGLEIFVALIAYPQILTASGKHINILLSPFSLWWDYYLYFLADHRDGEVELADTTDFNLPDFCMSGGLFLIA